MLISDILQARVHTPWILLSPPTNWSHPRLILGRPGVGQCHNATLKYWGYNQYHLQQLLENVMFKIIHGTFTTPC